MSDRVPNVGIIGTHVAGSLSPVMHNAAYMEMGVDLRYGRFEIPSDLTDYVSVDDRRELVSKYLNLLVERGIEGISVTMPFKEDVMSLDEVATGSAHTPVNIIGAANTLAYDARTLWIANNTDWQGAVGAIRETGTNIAGKSALVIGVGGTAKAVVYGLHNSGISRVFVANRTLSKAVEFCDEANTGLPLSPFEALDLHDLNNSPGVLKEVDIIYNCTPIGQDGVEGRGHVSTALPTPLIPSAMRAIKEGAVVVDSVYMPLETYLLKVVDAQLRNRRNLIPVNGTRMLLLQAVEQVKIFTGEQDVPVHVMEDALAQELRKRSSS